jgi:hypothetical protein
MSHEDRDILAAAKALEAFTDGDLTRRIASLEEGFVGVKRETVQDVLMDSRVSHELLAASYVVKRVAGQINVVIHTIGILLCLPHILEPGEQVLSLSLGAGNTGRAFDLETDRRIGEFKFIHWQGGAETIRQNSLFKDLYQMVEYQTEKRKMMYVLGVDFPMKFLTSGRALASVMSRNRKLWEAFLAKYGENLKTVRDYYAINQGRFELVDVRPFVPGLVSLGGVDEDDV